MTIKTGKRLYPNRISTDIGSDIYEVNGSVYEFTNEQLFDACDVNNWGGVVLMRTKFYAKVKVYTD